MYKSVNIEIGDQDRYVHPHISELVYRKSVAWAIQQLYTCLIVGGRLLAGFKAYATTVEQYNYCENI